LTLYLDASALLPLFIEEARTYDAHEHLRGNVLLISDFAIAEFSSGVAIGLVRRLDPGLRAPDALNIAIAQRCEANLLTFDGKMARSARSLGMNVIG
jgi:predicted nucleic acid-binding protein